MGIEASYLAALCHKFGEFARIQDRRWYLDWVRNVEVGMT